MSSQVDLNNVNKISGHMTKETERPIKYNFFEDESYEKKISRNFNLEDFYEWKKLFLLRIFIK